jgi:alcohol dehydrogenase class IV
MRLGFELSSTIGPNGLFNTPNRTRFSFPGSVIQEEGIFQRVLSFVDSRSPVVVIVDSNVEGLLEGIPKDRIQLTFSVQDEPDALEIGNLASQITSSFQDNICLIAVGGGSTIDRAKAVALHRGTGNSFNYGYGSTRSSAETFRMGDQVIAVPTLPGSGSETSRYTILKDEDSRKKPSRAWGLVPSISLLDPLVVMDAPSSLLLEGAFDAFVHTWETLINRSEYSSVLAPLAMRNLQTILQIAESWRDRADRETVRRLQICSAVGGILLSNSRVGLMHTLGETLSMFERVRHPQSLMVFMREVFSTYDREHVVERTGYDPEGVLSLWTKIWKEYFPDATFELHLYLDSIVSIVLEDRVLVEKEHPGMLSESILRGLISRSF